MGIELGKEFRIHDPPVNIRIKGVFDYGGVYKMMHAWLISKRFLFHENKYKDKVMSPFGNEVEIKWVAERKVTEFVKEVVTVEFHMWDFSEVEVIKEGKKKDMGKGRMEIKIYGDLILDYNKKFAEGSDFVKKLGEFYVKNVIYWDWRLRYAFNLEYLVYDLQAKIKKYLNMDTGSNAY